MVNAEAKSYMKSIKFGPIELSGVGCDLKAGTSDDGAHRHMLQALVLWRCPYAMYINTDTCVASGQSLTRAEHEVTPQAVWLPQADRPTD